MMRRRHCITPLLVVIAVSIAFFSLVACDRGTKADETIAEPEEKPPSITPHVSADDGIVCSVDESGVLECVGGFAEELEAPPEETFQKVAVGFEHICAIDIDDQLHCWGLEDADVPDPSPEVSFRDVSVDGDNTCAIGDDDTLRCWGPAQEWEAPARAHDQVAVAQHHVCTLDVEGTLECWGPWDLDDPLVTEDPPSAKFRQITAHDVNTCAIDVDGGLACWHIPSYTEITELPEGEFDHVALDYIYGCAVDTTGGAHCFGPAPERIPVVPESLQLRHLATVGSNVCGLDDRGDVKCWGSMFGDEGETGPPSKLERWADMEPVVPEDDGPSDEELRQLAEVIAGDDLSDEEIDEEVLRKLFVEAGPPPSDQGEDDEATGRTEGTGDAGPIEGLGDVESDGTRGMVGTGEQVETPPELKLKSPDVEDSCDASHIESIVEARSAALEHCYTRELNANPDLSGDVTMEWSVEPGGYVADVEASDSTLDHPQMEGCLERVVQRMGFDEPDGQSCDVAYPMSFSAPE